jgi:aldose 1-epimerase
VTVYPTGQQYEISSGLHRAVITEVGATLRSYSVAGNDVVRGFGATDVVEKGRGQQLLPWPNRIRDGRYEFDGEPQQLALSEPHRHNALHGLVRHVVWDRIEQTDDSIRQRVRVYPQPGWPGTVEATIGHSISDAGLRVTVEAANIGSTPVPFGYAAHPYLTVGETTVDEVAVRLPAARYLEVDPERLLPIEIRDVEGTEYDLRSGDALGSTNLDTAFTDLATDDDGLWRVTLTLGDRRAEIWSEPIFGWLQVFTGEDRRDLSIAVEPMTCGPDAFNPGPTEADRIVLQPGESFTGHWGITGR